MTQYQYREFHKYCQYGEFRHDSPEFQRLKLEIAVCRMKKIIIRELRIKKMLYFLVRVMRRFEK